MITPYMSARMTYDLALPNNSCGTNVAQGRTGRFTGVVVAADSTAYYAIGDTMYCIAVPFVRDTTPPSIDSVALVRLTDSSARLLVKASDDTSGVGGSMMSFSVDGAGQRWIFGTDRSDSSTPTHQRQFIDTISYAAGSHVIAYTVMVENGVGGMTSSGQDTLFVLGESGPSDNGVGYGAVGPWLQKPTGEPVGGDAGDIVASHPSLWRRGVFNLRTAEK